MCYIINILGNKERFFYCVINIVSKGNIMTTTTTGVATLKKLQKECLTIDLTQVRYKKGITPHRYRTEPSFDPDETLITRDVNTNTQGENPHIKFGGDGSRLGLCSEGDFIRNPNGKWKEPHYEDVSHPLHYENILAVKFQGGKQGRGGIVHNNFTDASILIDKSADTILGVLYALDNDYLNEWLRETIDPYIPNNWDELHAEKEFEVLITTTTYSTEKVKVVGRTYEDARENLRKTDPTLDVGGCFSGMKTTSSYEEWISLQEKEVA
jgi:hypothetical protein